MSMTNANLRSTLIVFAGLLTACSDSPTAPRLPAESPFNITVRYIGTPTAAQMAVVDSAVSRWRDVITGDVPDWSLSAPARTCFAAQPALSELVDDVILYVQFATIDGPGDALGAAGPCFVRNASSLPLMGYLTMDVADVELMQRAGSFRDVVLHEIGHVLGIGTVWPELDLVTGVGGSNPQFNGSAALEAYHQLGGTAAGVPVENTGGAGTRDSHWRESIFGSELMTGYTTRGTNPLSSITVGSLQDIGYTVNPSAATAYSISTSTVFTREIPAVEAIEEVIRPRYKVSADGTPVLIER